MKRYLLAALTACAVGFSGCSNDPTVNPNGNNVSGSDVTFFQVDRVGKPGIKALYLPFATHAAYNTAIPENDVAAYGPTVSTFVTGTAGRSAAIGGFAATLLVPDALIVNLNDASTRASYLRLGNQRPDPRRLYRAYRHDFGGRALQDDVVDVDLGLASEILPRRQRSRARVRRSTSQRPRRPTTATKATAPAASPTSRSRTSPARAKASRSARSRIWRRRFNPEHCGPFSEGSGAEKTYVGQSARRVSRIGPPVGV